MSDASANPTLHRVLPVAGSGTSRAPPLAATHLPLKILPLQRASPSSLPKASVLMISPRIRWSLRSASILLRAELVLGHRSSASSGGKGHSSTVQMARSSSASSGARDSSCAMVRTSPSTSSCLARGCRLHNLIQRLVEYRHPVVDHCIGGPTLGQQGRQAGFVGASRQYFVPATQARQHCEHRSEFGRTRVQRGATVWCAGLQLCLQATHHHLFERVFEHRKFAVEPRQVPQQCNQHCAFGCWQCAQRREQLQHGRHALQRRQRVAGDRDGAHFVGSLLTVLLRNALQLRLTRCCIGHRHKSPAVCCVPARAHRQCRAAVRAAHGARQLHSQGGAVADRPCWLRSVQRPRVLLAPGMAATDMAPRSGRGDCSARHHPVTAATVPARAGSWIRTAPG